jgi:cyclopropane fatty-acyl-phospholipid synthase-like methyltransferase
MKILDNLPGENLAQSDWDDTYLKPGKHPRRVDIVHEVYQEPAVGPWSKARSAYDKTAEDLGHRLHGNAYRKGPNKTKGAGAHGEG